MSWVLGISFLVTFIAIPIAFSFCFWWELNLFIDMRLQMYLTTPYILVGWYYTAVQTVLGLDLLNL